MRKRVAERIALGARRNTRRLHWRASTVARAQRLVRDSRLARSQRQKALKELATPAAELTFWDQDLS